MQPYPRGILYPVPQTVQHNITYAVVTDLLSKMVVSLQIQFNVIFRQQIQQLVRLFQWQIARDKLRQICAKYIDMRTHYAMPVFITVLEQLPQPVHLLLAMASAAESSMTYKSL